MASFFCPLVQLHICIADRSFTDVRMRYQNRNLALPACAEEGRHFPGAPEFCTFEAFRTRVRELTPDDFEAECAPGGR
jgi:acid phosphatase